MVASPWADCLLLLGGRPPPGRNRLLVSALWLSLDLGNVALPSYLLSKGPSCLPACANQSQPRYRPSALISVAVTTDTQLSDSNYDARSLFRIWGPVSLLSGAQSSPWVGVSCKQNPCMQTKPMEPDGRAHAVSRGVQSCGCWALLPRDNRAQCVASLPLQ